MAARCSRKLLSRIANSKHPWPCLILDGAMGTSLNSLGLNEREAWSSPRYLDVEHIRNAVKNVHMQFLSCGVDIITTNTYNSLIPGEIPVKNNETQWIIDNISLAYECIVEHKATEDGPDKKAGPFLAMSVGSFCTTIEGRAESANKDMGGEDTGKCRGYGYPASEILSYFNMRLSDEVLNHAARNKVEVIAFETIGDLMEVELICEVLCNKGDILNETGLSSWVTLTSSSSADTVDTGGSISACVEELAKCPYVTGVGVNCTEPHFVSPIIKTMKQVLKEHDADDKLIVVYPNSGETYLSRSLADGEVEHWKKSDNWQDWNFADSAMEWIKEGAHIIGGCCRIHAPEISELKQRLATTKSL